MSALKEKEGNTEKHEDGEETESPIIENLPQTSAFANSSIAPELEISNLKSEISEEKNRLLKFI